MKKIYIIITLLFILLFPVHGAMAQPKLAVDNEVFTFEGVPEGGRITHEFIIRNEGDTLLTITKVLPP